MIHAASVLLCFLLGLPLLQTQIAGTYAPCALGGPLAAGWGQRAASPLHSWSGLEWMQQWAESQLCCVTLGTHHGDSGTPFPWQNNHQKKKY